MYDRDVGEFVELELESHAAEITWGLTRPARLTVDGVEMRERFRVWEIVSAGTDRWLLLEAISGLPPLYERTLT